jgi:hypothetical protein
MRAASLRNAFALAAFALLFMAALGVASARTYNHGLTVWFNNDVTIGFGDEVRGDLDIVFGDVTCAAGGVIDGSVRTYFGNFNQLDGCRIGGRVTSAFDGESWNAAPFFPHTSTVDMLAENRRVFQSLAWDVVVLFIFLLFPLRVRVALDRVEQRPGLSAVAGVIALIAVLPIFVMLLLSVIGIPLIVLEIAAVFAGAWIGYAAVAMLIGRRLHELVRPHSTPSPLAALILGLVVVSAAQMLPVVGWAVSVLVMVVGLGAAILGFFREAHFQGQISGPPMNRPA